MWKYVKRYLPLAVLAGLFMVGEVLMDLVQPGIMSRIVDDGVLGMNSNGAGDLSLIWTLGLQMIGLVLFGGLCGSMNNVFVHLSGQNIGNEMRKDAFRRIMAFSFPQTDKFGVGSLVTRVTNDITQVQNFVSQFVRGMIRCVFLTLGSITFMFLLNREFGLVLLCAFPFIVGVLAFCLWKANPLFPRLQAQLDRINTIMQEDVSGIRIIKACVREVYEKARFGRSNDELIRTQMEVLVIFAFMNPAIKDAVSEAMREWTRRIDDTHYCLGSVMGPHPFPTIVRDFQAVISREVKAQLMEKEGRLPDAVLACVGGGSNAMGSFYHFIEESSVRLIGCEAAGRGTDTFETAATIATGREGIFHGMKSYFCQDEFGQIAPVYSISAGLDYPGIGPEHAWLHDTSRAEYVAITDDEAVEAFEYLSRMEGIIPAIESAHAVAHAIKLAPTMGKEQIIVITISGRGDKDVAAIARYRGEDIYE